MNAGLISDIICVNVCFHNHTLYCYASAFFSSKVKQQRVLATQEDNWQLWMLTVTWGHCGLTFGNVLSLFHFIMMYWILKCIASLPLRPNANVAVLTKINNSVFPLKCNGFCLCTANHVTFLHNSVNNLTENTKSLMELIKKSGCSPFFKKTILQLADPDSFLHHSHILLQNPVAVSSTILLLTMASL